MRHFLLVILSFSLSYCHPLFAQNTIRGKVIDGSDGQPLIGATAAIQGTTIGAATDIEGKYTLKVAPGTYTIEISFIGYETKTTSITVDKKVVVAPTIVLAEATALLDEIVITGELDEGTDLGALQKRKKAGVIMDVLSSEQLSRTGDVNVADAIRRIPSVTTEGGKFAYVRGLGDRYSQTLLNGLQIPGLDPERNSVQLDLIPAQLLENITVSKTFSPDLPGNFTGGLIDIITSNFPDLFTVTVSGRVGVNTQSSLIDDFISYNDTGGSDWLGRDDGTRDIPDLVQDPRNVSEIPNIISIFTSPDESAPQIEEYTRAFPNDFDPIRRNTPVDHRFFVSIGNQTDLAGGKIKWGYQGSLSYVRNYVYIPNARQEIYALNTAIPEVPELSPALIVDIDRGTDNVLWGALITTGFKFGDNHKVAFNYVNNQGGQRSALVAGGENLDDRFGLYFESSTLFYEERNLTSYQASGNHIFGNLKVDWSGAFTESTIDQPDLRFFAHRNIDRQDLTDFQETGIRPEIDGVVDFTSGFFPVNFYRSLAQDNFNAKLDLTYNFTIESWGIKDAKAKVGANYLRQDRTFNEFQFQYQFDDDRITASRRDFLSRVYDFVLDPSLVATQNFASGVYLVNTYDDLNNYLTDQNIYAAYAMIDFNINDRWRVVAGLRVEQMELRFTSDAWDNTAARNVVRGIEELNDAELLDDVDPLPSLNVSYKISSKFTLRGGYTRTLARPSFRELAPFETFDFIGGNVFVGNPFLKRTLIDNFDLRLDFFPQAQSNELYSFSIFYKNFTDPIERFFIRLGAAEGPATITPANTAKGEVFGFELEARKSFSFIGGTFFERLSGGANFAYMFSRASGETVIPWLPDEFGNETRFDVDRQLFGQAEYSANVYLNYFTDNLEANLIFNVQGPALSGVGDDRPNVNIKQPDVFTLPQPDLGFNIKYSFLENFSIRFSASNLINPFFRERYDVDNQDLFLNRFRTGRNFAVSIAFKY